MKNVSQSLVLLSFIFSEVHAENLNYNFINPSFLGGNPNNGPMLLNLANAQNTFKAPQLSAEEKFQKNLESAIWSKRQALILDSMFGTATVKDVYGEYDTAQYHISIKADTENTGGTVIIYTDKNTNISTTVNVSAN